MKNAVFWDVAQCGDFVNQFFYPENGGDAFLRNVVSHKTTLNHVPEDGFLL
jgi:hypothetical protein